MSTEEESIQALSRAVMTEARAQAEQALVEARQKADAIRSDNQQQAEAERTRILADANQQAARLHSQAIAAAELKARTLQLEQRELLLDEVFERAVRQIPEVQKSAQYKDITLTLLKEALEHLGSESAQVRSDSETMKIFSPELLAALSREIKVKLESGEPLSQGTGVIVQTPDGHRQFDNTLENRLKRMQDALRNPVYHLLMGEAL